MKSIPWRFLVNKEIKSRDSVHVHCQRELPRCHGYGPQRDHKLPRTQTRPSHRHIKTPRASFLSAHATLIISSVSKAAASHQLHWHYPHPLDPGYIALSIPPQAGIQRLRRRHHGCRRPHLPPYGIALPEVCRDDRYAMHPPLPRHSPYSSSQ